MMIRFLKIGVVFPLALIVWYFFSFMAGAKSSDIAITPVISERAVRSGSNAVPDAGMSPFSTEKPLIPDRRLIVKSRVQRMRDAGFSTPDSYNRMGLKELSERAKAGDHFAMVQLAEQYWEEEALARWDPGFEDNLPARQKAEEFFMQGIRSGLFGLADVVAKKHRRDNRLEDAQAWELVSAALGGPSGTNFTGKVPIRTSASSATVARADVLLTKIGLPSR